MEEGNSLVWRKALHQYGGRHLISKKEGTSLVWRKAPHQYGGRHLISMEEGSSLVWRKAPHQYEGRHLISMEEDTSLVWRKAAEGSNAGSIHRRSVNIKLINYTLKIYPQHSAIQPHTLIFPQCTLFKGDSESFNGKFLHVLKPHLHAVFIFKGYYHTSSHCLQSC